MKMPKISIKRELKHLERLITNNSPVILTAIGVIGVAGTAGLTWKAATDAERVVANHAAQQNFKREPEDPYYTSQSFSKKEKFELTWKLYIAPVSAGVLTCGAIIGAQKINARRAAAIAGVLAMTQDNFKEYKEKVEQKLTGPKKREVKEELAQEQADRVFQKTSLEHIDVAEGDVLCLESYTGRVFSSSRNKIDRAVNEFNARIIAQDASSLSDFYDILDNPDLDHTDISDEMGWNVNAMLEIDYIPVWSPKKKPAMAVTYTTTPILRPHEAGSFRESRGR